MPTLGAVQVSSGAPSTIVGTFSTGGSGRVDVIARLTGALVPERRPVPAERPSAGLQHVLSFDVERLGF